MAGPEYIISTQKGCIPHITSIDTDSWFKKHYLVYVDDFLHPGGYYLAQEHAADINTFLQIPHPIILAFKAPKKPSRKAKKRALETPRGVYMLSKQVYDSFVSAAKPSLFADFYTSEINMNIKTPQSLREAMELLCKNMIIDTRFLNDFASRGLVINIEKPVATEHITEYSFECACCAMYKKEYIRHIWSINEIVCLSIIQNHNYCQLSLLTEKARKEPRDNCLDNNNTQ